MKQFIPGIYDYIFKTIMTSYEYRDYIQFLIHKITGIEQEELNSDFKILSTFLPLEHKCQKHGQVDILYQYGKNNYINIEMNMEYSKSLLIKNHYYHCKIIGDKFFSGKKYENGKVIQINLNCFGLEKMGKDVNPYKVMNIYTHHIENENFIKYHLDMEKIYKRCYNKNNFELTMLEKMILILMEKDEKRLQKLAEGEEILEKVVRRIIKMNSEEYCIGMYDKEEVDRMFQEMLKQEIKEDAMKEGMEKGMEKGKMEEKNKIAVNMLKNNFDISFIQRITDLTFKEILFLKENLK